MVLSLRRDRAARGLTVAVAVAVFLGSWELLHHGRYARDQLSDIPVYEGYGFAMRNGLLPYRDIPVEYPPGALPAFAAPTYAGGYAATFGWLMAACGAGCLVLAALAGARPEALGFLAVSPLLVGSLALSRFDFWPELFVVAGVAFLVRDRHRPAFAALGAAVATKLYALALVPLALAWTWRRRGPRELGLATACGVAVVAAALLPFAILAPDGLWRSVWGESSRPLQVESLGAAVLMTFGHPTVISTHGSLNLAGQGALATASTAVQLAALAALWVAFARGQAAPARLLRYAAACLCAFVALGKVLSPQFLIWLVPLVPLVRGRRGLAATVLLAGALATTQVFFPGRYWEYVFHRRLAWVVLARDLLLVALLAVLSLPARARARSS
ncbi:MAG TPA: glycosyltransferase 87 family protein [Gaiellaceae bacterium]|nr:glycosyltransferase 87 family protein [Gaiellaceae bacterium]